MYSFKIVSLLFIFSFFCTNSVLKAKETNLLTNFQFSTTPRQIGESSAVSFLGEVGDKNFRANATYGLRITPRQLLKVSVEGLTQKLEFDFVGGDIKKWIAQAAVGGEYQFLLCNDIFKSINLGASYSHAFRRNLNTQESEFFDPITHRTWASNGGYGFLGATMQLWRGAEFGVNFNYDYVKFYEPAEFDWVVSGWGSSLNFSQQFAWGYFMNAQADFREPFNFYELNLGGCRSFCQGNLTYKLYGNFTDGKEGLPNVAVVGFGLDFFWGKAGRGCNYSSYCESDSQQCCSSLLDYCLANWVSKSAVYVPIVLTTPIDYLAIPDQFFFFSILDIETSYFFNSPDIVSYTATGLPAGATIDSNTGLISGRPASGVYFISITATSPQGRSQTKSFYLHYVI